ncbi:DUF7264 domain-containing protein [Nocardia gipuzkoensis]|uniref:LtfC-like domain-containing protein n=1 Tax=Nocardia gipuzkoensis TaxID=2749991 RepID=UPI00237D4DED|nr:hypothetical protein [Nocardia gipuzkoensis]MDE1673859.1 hypothetical protein [Nocardia gipuzkoensis]
MTLTLGWVAGRLRLALDPATDFEGRVELQSPVGTPTPWPAGTSAWLRLSVRGGTFEQIWPATITGAVMSWLVAADQVAQVPLNAWTELWLDYPDSAPIRWLEGPIQTGCSTGGIGQIVAVPGAGDGAVAVPVPGPAGPTGGAVIATGVAAIPLSGHRAVTRQPDGTLVYASNDDPSHMNLPIWITTGAADAGAVAEAIAFGEITESSWAWTPGPLYLGVYGAIVQVPPTAPDAYFLARLGAAMTPTSVFVDRSPSIQLI